MTDTAAPAGRQYVVSSGIPECDADPGRDLSPGGSGGGEAAIEICGLWHWFGEKEPADRQDYALKDNSLVLRRGEVVVMGGPSGSGKTTILTLIGGLRKVRKGSLKVYGRELNGLSERDLIAHRRRIGFIFQAHHLFESLTAFQNVKMATDLERTPLSEATPKIESLLDRLGLGHRVRYKPESMSGGQKQRVAVARAIVNEPQLILADEPTAALDKESGRIVVELLRDLAKTRGTTVLIVTHDARILNRADRIVSMEDGEIRSDVAVEETGTVVKFLHGVEVFGHLDTGELLEVARKMRRVTIPPGQLVFRQGDPGDRLFLIRSGAAEVYQRQDGDAEGELGRPVATLGPGMPFGEMALLTGEPRNASIVNPGPEPLVAYQLSKADFSEARKNSEELDEQLRKLLLLRVPK